MQQKKAKFESVPVADKGKIIYLKVISVWQVNEEYGHYLDAVDCVCVAPKGFPFSTTAVRLSGDAFRILNGEEVE